MSDDMRKYTTRSVATRTPEAEAQIAAAKVMPGDETPNGPARPVPTPTAEDAHASVAGRPGIPSRLPGGRK